MSITRIIKTAAAVLHTALQPNVQPTGETIQPVTLVNPDQPNEDKDLAAARTEASRIITQLERSRQSEEDSRHALSQATRSAIIASLNRYGPPGPAIISRNRRMPDGSLQSMGLETLDGKGVTARAPEPPNRVTPIEENVSSRATIPRKENSDAQRKAAQAIPDER